VNNDFHRGQTIFEVLEGLEVPDLDKVPEPQTNGTKDHHTNGAPNGVEASA
jgi:methylenetetrahydrofolate reductase (NADPH)